MSAPAKTKTASPSMVFLICKAIGEIKGGRKGASRQAIHNFLVENNGKTAGSMFNYHLRAALKKGIEGGFLYTIKI